MNLIIKRVSMLAVISLLSGCAQTPPSAPAPVAAQPPMAPLPINRLAVLVNDKTHSLRSDSGSMTDVEDAFSQQLISKGYSLADRSDVATVMKEVGFQNSGMTDSDVSKLGKMLNVPAVLIVNITACRADRAANTMFGMPATINGQDSHLVGHCKLGLRLVLVEKNQMILNRSDETTKNIGSPDEAQDGLAPLATTLASGFPPATAGTAQ